MAGPAACGVAQGEPRRRGKRIGHCCNIRISRLDDNQYRCNTRNMNADITAQNLAATADVDVDHYNAYGHAHRATLRGRGGAAAIGYGATEAQARADLAATIAFNITNNGRAIA